MTLRTLLSGVKKWGFFTKRPSIPYKHRAAPCGRVERPLQELNTSSFLLRCLGTGHTGGITGSAPRVLGKAVFRERTFQDPGKQG